MHNFTQSWVVDFLIHFPDLFMIKIRRHWHWLSDALTSNQSTRTHPPSPFFIPSKIKKFSSVHTYTASSAAHRIPLCRCAALTESAIAVHSLATELSYSHRSLGPMVSGTQVDEVKNCNKGEITSIRIFTASQKESHSVQKLKLVFIYLVLHLILHNTR